MRRRYEHPWGANHGALNDQELHKQLRDWTLAQVPQTLPPKQKALLRMSAVEAKQGFVHGLVILVARPHLGSCHSCRRPRCRLKQQVNEPAIPAGGRSAV
jgi:hypothetical protein